MKKLTLQLLAALSLASNALPASELIYTPVNPSFGGSPLNGSHLLNLANSQNDYQDPNSTLNKDKNSLEQFNERLQRSILSRLTTALSGNIIGSNGKINPGNFETTDFIINVEDLGSEGMRVTTTDKLTGDETVFEISAGL